MLVAETAVYPDFLYWKVAVCAAGASKVTTAGEAESATVESL